MDIRSKAEVKEQGAPDLKAVKRKTISLPYTQVGARSPGTSLKWRAAWCTHICVHVYLCQYSAEIATCKEGNKWQRV